MDFGNIFSQCKFLELELKLKFKGLLVYSGIGNYMAFHLGLYYHLS